MRVLAAVLVIGLSTPLHAQDMRATINQLFTFGDCGQPLCLDLNDAHGNHFIPSVTAGNQTVIAFLTDAISNSASNIPLSATSSGATFTLVGGLPVRSSTSAGPIFGERAQTLGKGRFYLGANVTNVQFTTINSSPLDNILINFAHQDVGNPGEGDPEFENDIIALRMNLDMSVTVAELFATWGILDFVDIGVAVPFVRTRIDGTSDAQILPFGSTAVHRFGGTDQNPILRATTSASGTSSGIGDVAARIKISLGQGRTLGAALLADVRFNTGNEDDLLGSGATSVRAFAVGSAQFGSFAPHINLGYASRTADLQNDAVLATIGFDNLMASWATFAADLITEWQVGDNPIDLPGDIVFVAPFQRRVPSISIPDRDNNLISLSTGVKFTVRGGTVLVLNAIAPLRKAGLQPDFIWTIGLEGSL